MSVTDSQKAPNQMRLAKPTNLTFIESSENSITVSWDAVDSMLAFYGDDMVDAKGYLVQCRDVVQNGWDNCITTSIKHSNKVNG